MQNYVIPLIILGIFVLYVLMWIFVRPMKILLKALAKGAVGCGALYLFNSIFAYTGFYIGVNWVTAAVCGVLGVNGFLLMLGLQLFI